MDNPAQNIPVQPGQAPGNVGVAAVNPVLPTPNQTPSPSAPVQTQPTAPQPAAPSVTPAITPTTPAATMAAPTSTPSFNPAPANPLTPTVTPVTITSPESSDTEPAPVPMTAPATTPVTPNQPTFVTPANPSSAPLTPNQPGEIPLAAPAEPTPVMAIPSVMEMEQDLQQSGKLAAEIEVQAPNPAEQGPLAALQPQNLNNASPSAAVITPPPAAPEYPTQSEHIPMATSQMHHTMAHIRGFFHHPFKKILAIGLTLQSIRGIANSVSFILVDFPELERQLSEHLITQAEVNEQAIAAVMITTSTVISLFFAMKLTVLKTKTAKHINKVISILLIIGNQYIHDYLAKLQLSETIGKVGVEGVTTLQQAADQGLLDRLLDLF